jgi:hypothetical protein
MDHAQSDLNATQRGAFRTHFTASLATLVTDDNWNTALTIARDLALTEAERWAR